MPVVGVGGLAATKTHVIVGSRDLADQQDLFQAYDPQTGELLWQHAQPAPGRLDYGNTPRATPLIHDQLVYTLGAFGHLNCLDLATGISLWQVSYTEDFGAELPIWGFAGSPIIVADQLIIQPGSHSAALAALDPITGRVLWKAPGRPAAYASLAMTVLNGHPQLIGLDQSGIVSWDARTGTEQWRITPAIDGDFGVPTPVMTLAGLLLTSENNGTRLHPIAGGRPDEHPTAARNRPAPDSYTPVVVGDHAFVVDNGLYCLDLQDDLRTVWEIKDRAFRGYASVIAADKRLLVLTKRGELILVDTSPPTGTILDRVKIGGPQTDALSHPALIGSRFYARIGRTFMCLDLKSPPR